MNVDKIKRWGKYTERSEGYKSMKYTLEYLLERQLTNDEKKHLNGLAEGSWDTVGTFVDMFLEAAKKKDHGK